jgi:hypothetical protein
MLSKLEKTLIKKLEIATQMLNDSHKSAQVLKQQLDDYRTETAQLKSKLSDGPSLPSNFKPSTAVQHALSTSKAQLATAQKLLQEEIEHFTQQKLADIASRNSKSLADYNYKQALNGPYAGAIKAINARRKEVQLNGVDVLSGFSGYSFKGLFDSSNKSLFTFELISDPDLEIHRQAYRVSKSVISPIGAGNEYTLSLVRPA